MKYDEFEKIFVSLATVWTNRATAEIKAGSYFKILNIFKCGTFENVCEKIVLESPTRLPLPADFMRMCLQEESKGKPDDTFTFVPEHIANSPRAKKAKRECFEATKKGYNHKDEIAFSMKTGFKTLRFAIVEAMILFPDRQQRQFVKHEEQMKLLEKNKIESKKEPKPADIQPPAETEAEGKKEEKEETKESEKEDMGDIL